MGVSPSVLRLIVKSVLGGLFLLVIWFAYTALQGTSEAEVTEDPVERGLSKIAMAIIIHAFFSASNVTVSIPSTEKEKTNP